VQNMGAESRHENAPPRLPEMRAQRLDGFARRRYRRFRARLQFLSRPRCAWRAARRADVRRQGDPALIVGYARVSTDGQSLAAQEQQLGDAGAEKVFRETASGAKSDRPQLTKALAAIGADDVLLVSRLDRLARSTRDLLNVLAQLDAKGALFRSLADTWADTTTAHGRLILTVLGGLAEFERELIKARTTEGRKRAQAEGVKLGRKPTLTHHQQAEARRRVAKGKESTGAIARSYAVSRWTIQRLGP
jgi:DNA invertase Pin-like site-specific DNA recombinase